MIYIAVFLLGSIDDIIMHIKQLVPNITLHIDQRTARVASHVSSPGLRGCVCECIYPAMSNRVS